MPSSCIQNLNGDGRVHARRKDVIYGAECSLEFREYERDGEGQYPKEAVSGDFSWHRKTRGLWVDLFYRSADLRGPLAQLIHAYPSDELRLRTTLLIDTSDLEKGDCQGHVGHWGLWVCRKFPGEKLG